MALPVIVLGAGALVGWKYGEKIVDKAKDLLHLKHKYDQTLSRADERDVDHLIANVTSSTMLLAAALYYRARGFPIAASALQARANQLAGG